MLTADSNSTSYLHIQGDIPTDLEDGMFISVDRKAPLKIYSLGFQPAKSIPEIPRWFLHKYAGLSWTVLDPFAGSGTTIIESLLYGSSIYWFDYHPLSQLICQVKTSQFLAGDIRQEALKIISYAANQKNAPITVKFANKDFWFQKEVQEGLEILKHEILQASINIRPLLWLAFASTVRKTSNMNDGMLLAARRSSVAEIPKRSRFDVYKYFQLYIEKAIDAMDEWNSLLISSPGKAQELPIKDARILSGNWECDAIVTSPPYINAIDYVWASKFELHWLGMVKNDRDRLDLYSSEIGTERIPRQECRCLGKTGNKKLNFLIEEIYRGNKYQASRGQNELRARVVYKYFSDMQQHFARSFLRLVPGGYYCFSVGEISKICGVDIPVASILTELAEEVGFCQQFHFHLLLKNRKLNIPRNLSWAGTIKHDTIVVLQKPVV